MDSVVRVPLESLECKNTSGRVQRINPHAGTAYDGVFVASRRLLLAANSSGNPEAVFQYLLDFGAGWLKWEWQHNIEDYVVAEYERRKDQRSPKAPHWRLEGGREDVPMG
jgi:hypothetical protein